MSIDPVNFLWKGSTHADGGATGSGKTGGYWNHAENWYEMVQGFSSGFTFAGSTQGDPGTEGFYYRVAERFPRGNDIVTLKGYSNNTHVGLVTDGPLVPLEYGGISGDVWFGATGEAGSGASGGRVLMNIESSYPFTYVGYDGPTSGVANGTPGTYGGFSADGIGRLKVKCSNLNMRLSGNTAIDLRFSDVENFDHTGTGVVQLRGCTVGNYTVDQGDDLMPYQGYVMIQDSTITNSFISQGTKAPFISLDDVRGVSGGDHTSIYYVNLLAQEHLQDINLRCNIDTLNFKPYRPAGSLAGTNVANLRSPDNSSTGLGRSFIRQINQGWGPNSYNDGSTAACLINLCCGATIEQYYIDSGGFELDAFEISSFDKIAIVDGTINANAVVRGQHPHDVSFQGFRIGVECGATQEGFLVLNRSATMEFGEGAYVTSEYKFGGTASDIVIQTQSGGGKG